MSNEKLIKIAVDTVCEIMDMSGHACCSSSACWKRAECDEAQHMLKKLRARREGEAG